MVKNDCYEEPPFNAVRGRDVYQLTSRRQLVTGLGSSFLSVIQQRFVNPASAYRVRAHNAVLDVVAGGGYELLIPGDPKAKKAVRVRLDFETKPTLTHGIHGTEQGPAQYKLIRDSSGWKAKIEVNETLHRRDLPFIIGHELDEMAFIVRQEPTDDAAILAEGQASLFKAGSTDTQVTAHDRAAARELCAMWQDYQHPPRGTDKAGRSRREDRIERMLEAMGLKESLNLFDKFRTLRAEGAKDKLLRKIGIPEERLSYLASPKFRTLKGRLPFLRSMGTIVTDSLISHLMIPLDPGRRLFLTTGINGGHDEKWLHDFVDNHAKFVIVKEAEKLAGGIIYRNYSQYRWKGSGPKPELPDSRFPKPGDAAAGTYHADWELAQQRGVPLPKTTFSSLHDFLLAVDDAWQAWYNTKPPHLPNGTNSFTTYKAVGGIQVTVFFYHIKPDLFDLQTAYVEASWF